MWKKNCGALPIVEDGGRVVGDGHGPGPLHRSGNEQSKEPPTCRWARS
jgi:hypothetical protein